MSILKLDVGKPLTLAVDDAKIAEGKFGKQAAFHAGDDVLFMSLDTASRQLDRLGLSLLTTTAGNVLRFEKVTKSGKTFINIDFAENGRTAGSPPAAQPPAPSTQEPKPTPAAAPASDVAFIAAAGHPDSPAGKGILARMHRAHEWTLQHIAPLYVAKGIPLSMDALAACAHSLFIESNRRG